MGQLHGKANFIDSAIPFLNLSEQSINSLWEAFNDVAEGFGVNKMEMLDICAPLQDAFNIKARGEMDQLTSKLFQAMDTDENGLVDALEFLGTIALLSAMKIKEKITFVFNCYDFDESGQITIDELTLSLKSTLTGLCKVTIGNACPTEAVLEEVSMRAFGKSEKHMENHITLQEFIKFCESTPEVVEWLAYHDDPKVYEEENNLEDSDLENEDSIPSYTENESLMHDLDFYSELRYSSNANTDEFAVSQPWINTVLNGAPSNPPVILDSMPEASLHLEWVYGYSNDFRNNVRYSSTGEVIYPGACAAIVYDIGAHSQRYFLDHSDMITCLAVNKSGVYVATGERGSRPRICIWDPTGKSMSDNESDGSKAPDGVDAPVGESCLRLLCCIRGFHQRGIGHLAWAPNERTLLSVGLDDFHRVAIYTWPTKQLRGEPQLEFSQKSSNFKVLACHFLSSNEFVTCGEKHILFWNRVSEARKGSVIQVFDKKKGCLGKKGKLQTFVSLTSIPEDQLVISGSVRGDLYIWEGRNCRNVLRAHASCVTSLFCFGHGFVSGGKDGKVRIWSRKLEPGAQFDLTALGSISPHVNSVATNDDGTKVLIGTLGGEIFEIASSDGCNLHYGPIVSGHCKNELWGMSLHPKKHELCTVGDDQTVRIWDFEAHRMQRMVEVDAAARACAYSPDGAMIALGFGSENKGKKNAAPNKKEGAYAILNESNLVVQYEARDSKKWIRDIKFSSDGQTLGVASSDNSFYLYNAGDFASKGKSKKNASFINRFDFSMDCEYVQVNCGNHELMYFDANTGEEITQSGALKDVEWSTLNCPLNWGTQGAWSQEPFSTSNLEINAVDRSCLARGTSSEQPPLMASGDCFGRLRLYRYPCVTKGSAYYEWRGHGNDIRRVLFHETEPYLFSCGGEDRCIFQWRIDREEPELDVGIYEDNVNSEDEMDLIDDASMDRTLQQELFNRGDYAMDIMIEETMPAEGDDLSSLLSPVKPWVASAIAPTTASYDLEEIEKSPLPINNNLQLEWVHGYRAQDSRNNLYYTEQGTKFVYPAATVAIVYDKKTHTQTFYRGHNDDVISIAQNPVEAKNHIFATGQIGQKPRLCVWDAKTVQTIRVFDSHHERGICALAFSSDGSLLASIGQDKDHSLIIYDWVNGTVKAKAKTDSQYKVQAVAFRRTYLSSDSKGCNILLVTAGQHHLKFWTLEGGRYLTSKNALFGKKGLRQNFPCVTFLKEHALVGTANGQIYLFHGRDVQTSIVAHSRSVTCIQTTSQGICSAGKDGYVKIWSQELECLSEFNLDENQPLSCKIRAIQWRPQNSTILVGNRASEIFEISSIDGSAIAGCGYSPESSEEDAEVFKHNKALIRAHYAKELWGLDVHPIRDEYCTVGDDKTLRVWDIFLRRQKRMTDLDTPSRACSYSPDGLYIAIGLGGSSTRGKHKKDGTFMVYQSEDLALIHEARDTKHWITCIRYSLDGQSLVVGSADNSVYIYEVANEYAKRATFTKHKSYITHVDLSADGQYLRSTCGGNELFFADATTGSHVASASALKNQVWSTYDCVFNWEVQGIWPEARTNTMINCTSRSIGKEVILSGDNYGNLKMFRFPCVSNASPYKIFKGHSAEIRSAKFSQNDSHALSVGGLDRCIFQWRHEIDEQQDEAHPANLVEEDSDLEIEGLSALSLATNGKSEDTFTPVKSYLSAMVPPSNAPIEKVDSPPGIHLSLETVHGYRTQDVRNNCRYSATGKIVYHTASIGVSYDQYTHTQSFYQGHQNREVVSLQVSIDGRFVATGESCARPRIHVWDATSCAAVSILPAFHERAVTYLSFSPSGLYLASLGQDINHSLCIWQASAAHSSLGEWQQPIILAHSKNTTEKVLFVTFCSVSPSAASTPPITTNNATQSSKESALAYDVVSGGVNHVTFWKIQAPNLIPMRGIFGQRANLQMIPCGALAHQRFVTGTATGHLYLWDGRSVARTIQAHVGTVNSLYSTHPLSASPAKSNSDISTTPANSIKTASPSFSSGGCVSGGRDGHVKLWSKDLTIIMDFDLGEAKPMSMNPSVRSVCWDVSQNRVLVGTRASEIYEISCNGGNTMLLHEGHFEDELFALTVHPLNPDLYATGGDDKTVRVWSLMKRCIIGKILMDTAVKSITWSPDGSLIAVGLGSSGATRGGQRKDGAFAIIDSNTMEIVHEGRDSKKTLSCMCFSPDGSLLAIGSHDTVVYFHSVADNYKLRSKCDKSTGIITHMDFSTDGGYLRVNSDAFELLFINSADGSWVPSPATMKDVSWATQSCVLSWPVQGIWPNGDDKTYINTCNEANKTAAIATGDSNACIKLFNYPVLSKDAPSKLFYGHSNGVSSAKFTLNDSYLISTGSCDRSILTWKISNK